MLQKLDDKYVTKKIEWIISSKNASGEITIPKNKRIKRVIKFKYIGKLIAVTALEKNDMKQKRFSRKIVGAI